MADRTRKLPDRATLLLCLALPLLAGCAAHVHSRHQHGVTVRAVAVDRHHRCSHACSHYKTARGWYLTPGHKHARGCDHALVRGFWIVR